MTLSQKITTKLKHTCFVYFRIWKYKWLSTCKNVQGSPVPFQPVLLSGKGSISFGKNVQIGVINGPHFYTSYAYIEARHTNSEIIFGDNISINNAFSVVADNSTICIEDDVLIGLHCQITDSDFHEINPDKRKTGNPVSQSVRIKKNVFIGNNVSILKGVCIGENTIIAHGAVVTQDIPDNTIAGGVPARILKSIAH